MMENLGEEYVPWMSQYMVMKRASIEANFHALYAKFIDHLKYNDILNLVVKETFRNIKVFFTFWSFIELEKAYNFLSVVSTM